jgi:hypothetical protein
VVLEPSCGGRLPMCQQSGGQTLAWPASGTWPGGLVGWRPGGPSGWRPSGPVGRQQHRVGAGPPVLSVYCNVERTSTG